MKLFKNESKNNQNKHRLSWNDILIVAVQRVTRYHLSLTESMKSEGNLIKSSTSLRCLSAQRNEEDLMNLKIASNRSKKKSCQLIKQIKKSMRKKAIVPYESNLASLCFFFFLSK